MNPWLWSLVVVLSAVAFLFSAASLFFTSKTPWWRKELERKMKVLEDEWEDVLDRIKRRGDRLSKERGILSRMSPKTEETPTNGPMTRKQELWAMKRNREAGNRAQ